MSYYNYANITYSYVPGSGIASVVGNFSVPNNWNAVILSSFNPGDSNTYTVTSIASNAFINAGVKLKNITIPNSVTSIGTLAFNNCTALTSITIPNSVTSMGNSVFYQCVALTSVNISNGLTSIPIQTFYRCNALNNITIPNSITNIQSGAFILCLALSSITIPNSVTSIDNFVFQNCSALTTITIPSSVTSIGNGVFTSCSSLTNITVDPANTNYRGVSGILFDKNVTTLIQYPCGNTQTSYTIPNTVTTFSEYAFIGCNNLTSINIPKNVTSIANSTFDSCSLLSSVSFESPSSVTSIGDSAFNFCSALTTITIPASVTSIGLTAFDSCTLLSSVYFSGNVLPNISNDSFVNIHSNPIAYMSYEASISNQQTINKLLGNNPKFTLVIAEPPVPPIPVKPIAYSYNSYLQPVSSLGTSRRYAGAISIGSRSQLGSANRIYSYYKNDNNKTLFKDQLVFAIYGKKLT